MTEAERAIERRALRAWMDDLWEWTALRTTGLNGFFILAPGECACGGRVGRRCARCVAHDQVVREAATIQPRRRRRRTGV